MSSPHPHWRELILSGDLMTTAQAAEYCGVRAVTIRQWVRRGHLAAINPGEVPPLFLRVALDRCEAARTAARKRFG